MSVSGIRCFLTGCTCVEHYLGAQFSLTVAMRPLRCVPALLLVSGLLAACDSADPGVDGHPLAGEWVETGSIQRDLATSDRSQQIVDGSRPADGELDIVGDASGTLRYASVYTDPNDQEGVTVFSIYPYQHPFPASYSFLTLSQDATWLTVWHDGTYEQYGREHYGGPAAYTLQDGQLTVNADSLAANDGSTATVGGVLRLPLLTLDAGVETEVEEHRHAVEPGDVPVRLVLEPDGDLQAYDEGDSGVLSYAGTWQILSDWQVRLMYPSEGQPVVVDYDYLLEGGTLYLSLTREVCANIPNPECLRNYERQFGMAPKSLTRLRDESGTIFTPAP